MQNKPTFTAKYKKRITTSFFFLKEVRVSIKYVNYAPIY